jgi:hypothetical protein
MRKLVAASEVAEFAVIRMSNVPATWATPEIDPVAESNCSQLGKLLTV